MVTIDELCTRYGQPDVLFVDVEGAEAEALKGARETLKAQPSCFVEVHVPWLADRDVSAEDILGVFPSDAYDLFVSSEARPAMVPLESARELLRDRFFMVAGSKQRKA